VTTLARPFPISLAIAANILPSHPTLLIVLPCNTHCSLTFVHHIGKDKKRGHLGAANLIAGIDVADCIDLEEKEIGHRKIKITNKKMKDSELREPISMDACREVLGEDEDGRVVSSLVLRRRHRAAKAGGEGDPRLDLALKIIADNKGKMSLNMNALAEEMARRYATEDLTDDELEKAKEVMRNFLRKEVTGGLAPYARMSGSAPNAPYEFEDRS